MSKKDKDPAFLFYSKDFYEGTRMMLPEERGCFIDLLIYQHQHGYIPDDVKRIGMYCSGVSEACLKATLKAKFTLTEHGWHSIKLEKVVNERKVYIGNQSINGAIGQFWKKSKTLLDKKDFEKLRKIFSEKNTDFIYEKIKDLTVSKEALKKLIEAYPIAYPKAFAKASLKHAIEIEDAIEDEVKDEDLKEKKQEIIFPFNSKEFITHWGIWKDYKLKTHHFTFKSPISEQAGLKILSEMAENSEINALKIIEQSIANGWKGFFKLDKNKQNGAPTETFEQSIEQFHAAKAVREARGF